MPSDTTGERSVRKTRRILLVGTAATEMSEVCDELTALVPQWSWDWVTTGLQALDRLTGDRFDAVVADNRLPDLSGIQLLSQTLSQWPQTHRVILADLGDLDALLRCVGGAHQFLARPLEAQRLLTTLRRAFQVELWLPSHNVRQLLGRLPALPSQADNYHAIVNALDREDLDEAARRIAEDPPLSAKTLQLSNSAAWGPPLDETDPRRAARDLGISNLRSLLLLSHTGSAFRDITAAGFDVARFAEHARQTSRLARRIAEAESAAPDLIRQSACAGLLHNLGKLALAVNLTSKYRKIEQLRREHQVTAWEAEQGVFGATHGEVGGSLLALWGLPLPVVEAVAFHHHPTCLLSPAFSPLTAVHVANTLVGCPSLELARQRLDLGYLGNLRLDRRVDAWWACRNGAAHPKP